MDSWEASPWADHSVHDDDDHHQNHAEQKKNDVQDEPKQRRSVLLAEGPPSGQFQRHSLGNDGKLAGQDVVASIEATQNRLSFKVTQKEDLQHLSGAGIWAADDSAGVWGLHAAVTPTPTLPVVEKVVVPVVGAAIGPVRKEGGGFGA